MYRKDHRPVEASPGESHLPMSGLIRLRLRRLMMLLGGLLTIQTFLIAWLEDLSLFEAFWLTTTTLVTVGYGDFAPETATGRLLTIGVMYVASITILTLIVSDYIEYRFYRRERIIMGRWRYNMKNHIVIINTPRDGGPQYFTRLATQIRAIPGYESTPIQLLTNAYPDGLPPELKDVGIVHFTGNGSDPRSLRGVNIVDAKHIIVLAPDECDPISDSLTFDIVHRLSELNLTRRTTVECVSDENRARYTALGTLTVLRPVRTYPEIMVRAVVSPGTEKVLEDMFNYANDHPHRYNLTLKHLKWSDVVSALIHHGVGTALAYVDQHDQVICHPRPDAHIEGKSLIVLVQTNDTPSTEDVKDAIDRYEKFLGRWEALREANNASS